MQKILKFIFFNFFFILFLIFSKSFYIIIFNNKVFRTEKNSIKFLDNFLFSFINNYLIFVLFIIFYYLPIYLDYIYLIHISLFGYFFILFFCQINLVNTNYLIKYLFFNNILIKLIKYSFIYNTLFFRILNNYYFRFCLKSNYLWILIFIYLLFYLIIYFLLDKIKNSNNFQILFSSQCYYQNYMVYLLSKLLTFISNFYNFYIIVFFIFSINFLEEFPLFYKFILTKEQHDKKYIRTKKFEMNNFQLIFCFEHVIGNLFLKYKKNKDPIRYKLITNFDKKEMSQFFFYSVVQSDKKTKRFSFTYPYSLSYIFDFFKEIYDIEQIDCYLINKRISKQKVNKLLNCTKNIQIFNQRFFTFNYVYYYYEESDEDLKLQNKNKKNYVDIINTFTYTYTLFLNQKNLEKKTLIINDNSIQKFQINKILLIILKIFSFYQEHEFEFLEYSIDKNIIEKFIYDDKSFRDVVQQTIFLRKIYTKKYKFLYNKVKKILTSSMLTIKKRIKKNNEIKYKRYQFIKLLKFIDLDENFKFTKIGTKFIHLFKSLNYYNFSRNLTKGIARNKRRKVMILNFFQKNLKSFIFNFIYKIHKKQYINKKIKSSYTNFFKYLPYFSFINALLLLFQLYFRKYLKIPFLYFLKYKILYFLKVNFLKKTINQKTTYINEKYIYCTIKGQDFSETKLPLNWKNEGLKIKIFFPFQFKNTNKRMYDFYFLTPSGNLQSKFYKKKKSKNKFLYKKINLKLTYFLKFLLFKIFKKKYIKKDKHTYQKSSLISQSNILYFMLKLKTKQYNFMLFSSINKKKYYNFFFNMIFNNIFNKKNIIKNHIKNKKFKKLFFNQKKLINFYQKYKYKQTLSYYDLKITNFLIENSNYFPKQLITNYRKKILYQIQTNYILTSKLSNELQKYSFGIKFNILLSLNNLQQIQTNILQSTFQNYNFSVITIFNSNSKYNFYSILLKKQFILLVYDKNIQMKVKKNIIPLYFCNKEVNDNLFCIQNQNKNLANFNSIIEDLFFINIIFNQFYFYKIKI